MFCPRCGTEISDNALFCFNCGNSIDISLKEKEQFQTKEKRSYDDKSKSREENLTRAFDNSYNESALIEKNSFKDKNLKILIGVGFGVIVAIVILIIVLIVLFNEKNSDKLQKTKETSIEQSDTKVLANEPEFEKNLSDYNLKKYSLDIFNYLVSDRWSLEHKRDNEFTAYWFKDEENAILSIATYHPDDPSKYRKLDSESLKAGCTDYSLASDNYEIIVDTYSNGDFQGYIYTTQGYSSMGYWGPDVENRLEYAVWLSPDNKYSGEIQILYPAHSEYNYHEEFLNVINNIECLSHDYSVGIVSTSLNEDSKNNELNTPDVKNITTDVSPDIKEFLDSYELFMDKYIECMEKVESDASTISLMTDYYDILAQYDDYVKKLDKLENSSLSETDYEYYIEVTSRVTKKMLKASI